MSYATTQELINNKLKKYNEEEFYCLINSIDNKELIKPIKKNSKKFIQDTKGWRIDKLDKNKLKEIYFKYVYKKREPNLSANLVNLINQNSVDIIDILESKLDDIENIKLEIRSNNKQYLDKIVSVLIDTYYSENIILCFKLIDIELGEESSSYIEKVIKQKKLIKEEKIKITNDITIEFNEKLKESEKNYNEIIKNKEKQIKALNSHIDKINKKFSLEIEKKEIEIFKLKDHNVSKEIKLNLKLETLNKKIVDLEQNLKKSIVKTEEAQKINYKKEEEINKLVYLLEDKYSMFDKYAKSRWEKENKELLLKNREIEKNIIDLDVYKQCIEEELVVLKKDKENIESAINSLEDNSKDFIKNINYIIDRIRKCEIIEDDRIDTKNEVSSRINHIPSRLIEENPEVKAHVYDFIDDLSDNFESIGIGNDYTYDLAKYVYSTISNKMGLFIMGYNNRLFADAISYTMSNSSADILVIPPGFTDSRLLIETVNNLTSKVVLIENTIDNVVENVYMPLLKENQEKILIFSMESNENINIIPKSVFNYLMVVDLDSIIESEQVEALYASITSDDIFKLDKNKKIKKSRLLRDLSNIVELSNISKTKIIEVINIINNFDSEKNSKNGIYSLLLFSVGMLSKSQNKYEQIENFIKKQNFEREKLDILDFIIGMGNKDE
ncbi:Uncharacterised protein [[Clostridium] sordellii]|uniref:hypothetical protein n=1 Tax=Paraclostridium sordellii TaxID=1505 RepID=UPI0005DCB5A8|nr:hypothetical protein [Paeniclostridium sordellii]CEP95571.1 Uncharacterised protein [[Clostridium] sordellii] [Paeniclostridium sordellii]